MIINKVGWIKKQLWEGGRRIEISCDTYSYFIKQQNHFKISIKHNKLVLQKWIIFFYDFKFNL